MHSDLAARSVRVLVLAVALVAIGIASAARAQDAGSPTPPPDQAVPPPPGDSTSATTATPPPPPGEPELPPPPPPPGAYAAPGGYAASGSYQVSVHQPAPVPARVPTQRVEPYVEGRPLPPGAVIEERTRPGLWITGISIFGALYMVSTAIAMNATDDGAQWLWLPVFGPFVAASAMDDDLAATLTFMGFGQAVGAGLFLWGMLATRKVVVYWADAGGQRLAAAPFVTRGGGGVTLSLF